MRRAIALSIAAAVLAAPGVSRAWTDPYFGPTSHGATSMAGNSGREFHEALADLHARLLGGDTRARSFGAATPQSAIKRDVVERSEGLHLVRALQIRSGGGAMRVLGEGLPVDAVSGVLPGSLLAARLGLEAQGVGAYATFGGGTFTVFRHLVVQRDGAPTMVWTSPSAYGFVGFGAEAKLHPRLTIATELALGRLYAQAAGATMIAPDPTETVRTAVAAVRFEY